MKTDFSCFFLIVRFPPCNTYNKRNFRIFFIYYLNHYYKENNNYEISKKRSYSLLVFMNKMKVA